MGLLDRLFPRPAPVARIEPVLPVEARSQSYGNGWDGLANMTAMGGGGPVAPHLAENLSAIVGAVELIANAIASLPASIQQDTADGRVAAPDTATAWSLLERPNPRQSWPALAVMLVSQYLLQGNGVAAVQTDRRGAVTGLVPVPWPWLNPVVVAGGDGPRVAYDLVHNTTETRLLGLPRRLLDSDVLHVRARSDAGVIGRSVLSRAAGVIREGLEMATAAEATWKNGMRPSGVFMSPTYLNETQRNRAEAAVTKFRGAINVGKLPLLEGGWEFKPLAMTSADAEFLGSRRFNTSEIARLFNIPEPLLQMGDTPASPEPYLAAFAQLTLAPIVGLIEAEFDHAVLPAGYHLQLDMAGLMRGNYSAVMAANAVAVQSRFFTPNDARRAVGLPAHKDGDTLGTGPAPNWPADAKGVPHMGPTPGKTGTGVPDVGTHQNEGAA